MIQWQGTRTAGTGSDGGRKRHGSWGGMISSVLVRARRESRRCSLVILMVGSAKLACYARVLLSPLLSGPSDSPNLEGCDCHIAVQPKLRSAFITQMGSN